jgi:mono/diheme cytochrome c family protein
MKRHVHCVLYAIAAGLLISGLCQADEDAEPTNPAQPAAPKADFEQADTTADKNNQANAVQAQRVQFYLEQVKPLLTKRCVGCHGPDEQESGLRVDTAAGLLEGGYSGAAVVPGKSAQSLLIHVLQGQGDLTRMPLEDDPLEQDQLAALVRWIDSGAHAPLDEKPLGAGSLEDLDHWAFQPIALPEVPQPRPASWPRNGIDHFVLATLNAKGLTPALEASRATLIRRVSLDLLGLLPTPRQVDAFLLDNRPDAYERLVDRLLNSPHYGERWGRHWLDAARYADSNGYTIDGPRSIWKYRDWVIGALNRDLPFDQFVIEQIAGDLLPEAPQDQIVATGFHRNTLINQEGGTDQEQFRIEAVGDRVDTTGTVFLGLSIGCARCHDHKFDPLTQRDYYRLFAFFNNSDDVNIEVPTPEEITLRSKIRSQVATLEKQRSARAKALAPEFDTWLASLEEVAPDHLPAAEVLAILDIPPIQRTDDQRAALVNAHLAQDDAWSQLTGQIARLKGQLPKVATSMVLRRRAKPRETHIMIRGEFLRLGAPVQPDVPGVLPDLPEHLDSPTRLDLARWLVSPENPLTARVTVNRIWQRYFGAGIVATENDFGIQSSPPSHPQLLDWLAARFMQQGWSLKQLHRTIVTSATYRQDSALRENVYEQDPTNALLARQNRLRVEAEVIRDVALDAAGLLSRKVGGPSVFPPQPEGVMRLAQVNRPWKVSDGEDRYRRGIYTYFWRSVPYPLLTMFDAPGANTTCTRRPRSNTPLQALTLLNDTVFTECAEALALRVLAADATDDAQRLRYGFRLCLAREPTAFEQNRLEQLLAHCLESGPDSESESPQVAEATHESVTTHTAVAVPDPHAESGTANETSDDTTTTPRQLSAWTTVARVLLNLDEFITRE